jgi:hypothetical protein
MAEVLQCHVFARPDFAMGRPHGGAPRGPIEGGLHGGGAPHFRWVDRIAAGVREPRCASERGLAMGGGRHAERPFSKSVARCHRTVLAYWKFESISLSAVSLASFRFLRRAIAREEAYYKCGGSGFLDSAIS